MRRFVGFETPFLEALARALLEPPFQGRLGTLVVVLPGRRAGRRLLELLTELQGGAIEPPRIVTEAALAQALSDRPLAMASPAAVEWAWFDVLSRANPAEWEAFAPGPSAQDPWALRWSVARQLTALDRELAAGEGADILRRPGSEANARMAALAALSARVTASLEATGRVDPARSLRQVLDPKSRRSGLEVVLGGVVEISPTLRALLESLTPRPHVFIHGGQDLSEGFDELGAVVPEFWERRAVPLGDEQWLAVDDPAQAISSSLDWLSRLPPKTGTDQIVIGLFAQDMLPSLAHALGREGLAVHAAAAGSLRESAPYLALEALHGWVARHDFAALASVLRHPDLEPLLRASGASLADALERADRWHRAHLPDDLQGAALVPEPSELRPRQMVDAVRELCAELEVAPERALTQWTPAITGILCRIYPSVPDDASSMSLGTRSAMEWFSSLTLDLGTYPEAFFSTPMTGTQALRLWLEWAAGQALRPARVHGAIEALGWLELAFEDAPHLLLLGLNDGWVPEGERASALAEDRDSGAARSPQARTRLARDVHALTAIASQRAGSAAGGGLHALTLRRGAGEDPLRPSRLLFHTDESRAIERARTFFSKDKRATALPAVESAPPSALAPILPLPIRRPPERVRISAFKAFLHSPYFYYLQNELKLERARDDAFELDPLGYGSFLHEVLDRWAKGDTRDSKDPARIEAGVCAELEHLAREQFGARPLPAVRLQLQQLRRRLGRFAERQAELAEQGWRVHSAEKDLKGASLEVDGAQVLLSGRVDRIDRNQKTNVWRIIDYKSGDGANEPLKSHRLRTRWVDLQLPLYRHFLSRELAGEIEVGYFALSSALDECGWHRAEFKAEDYDEALEEARRLLRLIVAGDFAQLGRATPADRVQRALCGLSLLSIGEEASAESEFGDDEASEESAP